MMTYQDLLRQTISIFETNGVEDAAFQAKQLLLSHFGLSPSRYMQQREQAPEAEINAFLDKAQQLIAGEPLQYVLGEWEFMGLSFAVGKGVLIPRPETEQLCELALSYLAQVKNPVCFDLCAGTGCIGITVAKLRPDAKVFLFEKSPEAIAYCKQNICLHQLENVSLIPWDIFQKYDPPCMADAILSNPPYIETGLLPRLQVQVRREPAMALDGGQDGLMFYRAINECWLDWLKPSGLLAVEHGEGQSGAIMDLFAPKLSNLTTHRDLAGFDRLVSGKRKESLDYTVNLM